MGPELLLSHECALSNSVLKVCGQKKQSLKCMKPGAGL